MGHTLSTKNLDIMDKNKNKSNNYKTLFSLPFDLMIV